MFTTSTSTSPSQIFQTYLLPAIPFRRRQSSASTSPGASSVSSSASPPPTTYLRGHTSHISCSHCHADLALTSQIISKGFTGRHGRAYLVSPATSPSAGANALVFPPASISKDPGLLPNLPNTFTGKPVPRQLVTGLHTVCDVSCKLCDTVLGWKYVGAEDEAQRYKVGKFILETKRVAVASCWENGDDEEDDDDDDVVGGGVDVVDDLGDLGGVRGRRRSSRFGEPPVEDEEVLFDSQDEEECEDLFAGVWSPQLASRRRSRRLSVVP